MNNSQNITLTLEQLNSIINNINAKDIPDNQKRKKGNIEKLKSGSYRFSYTLNGKKYREVRKDITSDTKAEEKLDEWIQDIEDRNL